LIAFLGYSPTALVEDAEAAAQRILVLAEESEVTDETTEEQKMLKEKQYLRKIAAAYIQKGEA